MFNHKRVTYDKEMLIPELSNLSREQSSVFAERNLKQNELVLDYSQLLTPVAYERSNESPSSSKHIKEISKMNKEVGSQSQSEFDHGKTLDCDASSGFGSIPTTYAKSSPPEKPLTNTSSEFFGSTTLGFRHTATSVMGSEPLHGLLPNKSTKSFTCNDSTGFGAVPATLTQNGPPQGPVTNTTSWSFGLNSSAKPLFGTTSTGFGPIAASLTKSETSKELPSNSTQQIFGTDCSGFGAVPSFVTPIGPSQGILPNSTRQLLENYSSAHSSIHTPCTQSESAQALLPNSVNPLYVNFSGPGCTNATTVTNFSGFGLLPTTLVKSKLPQEVKTNSANLGFGGWAVSPPFPQSAPAEGLFSNSVKPIVGSSSLGSGTISASFTKSEPIQSLFSNSAKSIFESRNSGFTSFFTQSKPKQGQFSNSTTSLFGSSGSGSGTIPASFTRSEPTQGLFSNSAGALFGNTSSGSENIPTPFIQRRPTHELPSYSFFTFENNCSGIGATTYPTKTKNRQSRRPYTKVTARSFEDSNSGFGAVSKSFGDSNSGFCAVPNSFGGSNSGFGAVSKSFGDSNSGFCAVSKSFGGSNSGFGAVSKSFGSSNSGFGAVSNFSTQFGSPQGLPPNFANPLFGKNLSGSVTNTSTKNEPLRNETSLSYGITNSGFGPIPTSLQQSECPEELFLNSKKSLFQGFGSVKRHEQVIQNVTNHGQPSSLGFKLGNHSSGSFAKNSATVTKSEHPQRPFQNASSQFCGLTTSGFRSFSTSLAESEPPKELHTNLAKPSCAGFGSADNTGSVKQNHTSHEQPSSLGFKFGNNSSGSSATNFAIVTKSERPQGPFTNASSQSCGISTSGFGPFSTSLTESEPPKELRTNSAKLSFAGFGSADIAGPVTQNLTSLEQPSSLSFKFGNNSSVSSVTNSAIVTKSEHPQGPFTNASSQSCGISSGFGPFSTSLTESEPPKELRTNSAKLSFAGFGSADITGPVTQNLTSLEQPSSLGFKFGNNSSVSSVTNSAIVTKSEHPQGPFPNASSQFCGISTSVFNPFSTSLTESEPPKELHANSAKSLFGSNSSGSGTISASTTKSRQPHGQLLTSVKPLFESSNIRSETLGPTEFIESETTHQLPLFPGSIFGNNISGSAATTSTAVMKSVQLQGPFTSASSQLFGTTSSGFGPISTSTTENGPPSAGPLPAPGNKPGGAGLLPASPLFHSSQFVGIPAVEEKRTSPLEPFIDRSRPIFGITSYGFGPIPTSLKESGPPQTSFLSNGSVSKPAHHNVHCASHSNLQDILEVSLPNLSNSTPYIHSYSYSAHTPTFFTSQPIFSPVSVTCTQTVSTLTPAVSSQHPSNLVHDKQTNSNAEHNMSIDEMDVDGLVYAFEQTGTSECEQQSQSQSQGQRLEQQPKLKITSISKSSTTSRGAGLPFFSKLLKQLIGLKFDYESSQKITKVVSDPLTKSPDSVSDECALHILDCCNLKGAIQRSHFPSNWNHELWDGIQVKLASAGLKSLGRTVSYSVLDLIATIAMLFHICQNLHLVVTPLNLNDPDIVTKQANDVADFFMRRVSERRRLRFVLSLVYVTTVNRRHPLVYHTLELGNSWEEAFYYLTNGAELLIEKDECKIVSHKD